LDSIFEFNYFDTGTSSISMIFTYQVIGVMVRTLTGLDDSSSLPLTGPESGSAWDKVGLFRKTTFSRKTSSPKSG
jgi:hypothetical protein